MIQSDAFSQLCHVVSDDNDLIEFDYERYLMEEVKLRGIVDNPAASLVRASLCSVYLLLVNNIHAAIHRKNYTALHTFNGPFSGTTRASQYQKCETNLDFTEVRDSEWQWHQLGPSAPHHSVFLQTGCPSCHPTNSVNSEREDECVHSVHCTV